MPRDLRSLARGQHCMVRIPGICNRNPETTVLAHIRRAATAGVGQKPPDTCAVWACSACHDEIDRRTHLLEMSSVNDYLLDALCRQLAWYEKNEVLGVLL